MRTRDLVSSMRSPSATSRVFMNGTSQLLQLEYYSSFKELPRLASFGLSYPFPVPTFTDVRQVIPVTLPGRFRWVMFPLPSAPRLYHEIAPVRIQTGPVQRMLRMVLVEVNYVVVGHEPVFVVADEKVGGLSAKEPPTRPSPACIRWRTASSIPLACLLQQYILVGPGVPVSHRFSPWSARDEFGQSRGHILHPYN